MAIRYLNPAQLKAAERSRERAQRDWELTDPGGKDRSWRLKRVAPLRAPGTSAPKVKPNRKERRAQSVVKFPKTRRHYAVPALSHRVARITLGGIQFYITQPILLRDPPAGVYEVRVGEWEPGGADAVTNLSAMLESAQPHYQALAQAFARVTTEETDRAFEELLRVL